MVTSLGLAGKLSVCYQFGTVFVVCRPRKDGRWEGRYTAGYDPVTGKQIFKNVLGRTQAEVKDKINTALEELKRIDVIVSDQMTTGE